VKGRTDGDRAGGGEKQRIAVGLRLRDILRGHRAIGAGLVLDSDRLVKRALHLGGDHPRGAIGGAARGKSDDQAHRSGGIILSVRKRAGDKDKRDNKRT